MTKVKHKSIRVFVTGVGGGGIGSQIVKALRLSALQYYILGSDVTPISKGLMEVNKPYLLPPASNEKYFSELLGICKAEKVDVLFPGSEPELLVLSQYRDELREAGIFLPIQGSEVIDICSDKAKTMKFLKENGFSVPKTLSIEKESDLHEIDFFPAILKPSVGAGGSAGILLVQNTQEALMFGKFMLTEYKYFIAQEYIGTVDSEYTVGVLTSMEGELINSVAVKRNIKSGLGCRSSFINRSERSELGPTLVVSSGISQGQLGTFPEVTKPAQEIAKLLGATGAINIQGRLVNGVFYVFEINPRYSGTTSIRAIMGYNEPDILIRKYLLGEIIKPFFEYKVGEVVRGLDEVFVDQQKIIHGTI